jgi:dolichol-phosphate mannosyltransferase
MSPRVLIMIPTLNERGNIAALVDEILALKTPGLEILVIDDESPDGTAELVAELARTRPGVRLLRRPPPAGRGLAGRDGFLYALEHGASFLIEMDGDLSHPPRYIPVLLAAMAECDVAVGSRLVPGGSDLDRPAYRRALTIFGSAYARLFLGLDVVDANSGFRCYSRMALEAVSPATLKATGCARSPSTSSTARKAGRSSGRWACCQAGSRS